MILPYFPRYWRVSGLDPYVTQFVIGPIHTGLVKKSPELL